MGRRVGERSTRCPLCGSGAYPWIAVPLDPTEATVGLLSPVDPDDPDAGNEARLIDRCSDCGAGIIQGPEPIDLAHELELLRIETADGSPAWAAPNRASWQGGLGGDGWAPIQRWPGRLLLTPRSLAVLIETNGMEPEATAFPPWGENQRWMWQSVLNGITLHTNFMTEVRAGRLRRANARSGLAYAADMVASVLATPLVLLVSVPLEAVAALVNRGGRMIVRARPGPA